MISKQAFGRTEHKSTRIIFGAYALHHASQAEADRILDLLLEHGVNHNWGQNAYPDYEPDA